MISFALKLLTLPILFAVTGWILPSIQFGDFWTASITIAILIAVGIPMEKLLLTKKTFWITLLLDFISTVSIIWLMGFFFSETEILFTGAVILSILISIAEYYVHRFLLIKERPIAITL